MAFRTCVIYITCKKKAAFLNLYGIDWCDNSHLNLQLISYQRHTPFLLWGTKQETKREALGLQLHSYAWVWRSAQGFNPPIHGAKVVSAVARAGEQKVEVRCSLRLSEFQPQCTWYVVALNTWPNIIDATVII